MNKESGRVAGEPVETLRWRKDTLEMIDQRHLPASFVYVRFTSAAEVAAGIRDMVVRGAPAIGCAAAYGIALEAVRLRSAEPAAFAEGLEQAFSVLAASRPTAINLFWALDRMRALVAGCEGEKPSEIADKLLAEAHQVLSQDVLINRAIGAHGAELLPNGSRVLTHCNAGALATGGHGTALGVIRSAIAAGKTIYVIADETRPYLQGSRLTAWEMVEENIPVTIITDSSAGHLMSRGDIDAIIIGADRVAANGDVANKIGSYSLAVLARHHGIPFYVACPLSSIDLGIPNGAAIPIEERSADEVTGYKGQQWAAPGVSVRNPAFDVTPASLVDALITEKGVLRKPDEEKLRAIFSGDAQAHSATPHKQILVSVVFSFRNEEDNIPELVRRVSKVFKGIEATSCEMVFVNDDSTDRSLELLMELRKKYPIRIINMSRRFGVTSCFLAGFAHSRGDAVVTMDSDLQDPPELLPEMIERFRSGAEVVHTTRTHRDGESRFKMWVTRRAYKIINGLSDIRLPENTGDFKLHSRNVIQAMLALPENDPYLRGLSVWVGYRQDFVYYRREPRFMGETRFPLLSYGPAGEFIKGVTAFSAAPLYFALLFGFATVLVSIGLVLFALITKIIGSAVAGVPGVLIAVAFFSGVVLMTIGLIGLYVARIYNEVKRRPRYIVKDVVEPDPKFA